MTEVHLCAFLWAKAGPDEASSSVHASGFMKHLITDAERKTFDIDVVSGKNTKLHKAVEKYYGGTVHGAWVKKKAHSDPELYAHYKWPEVQTTLRPIQAYIVGAEPVTSGVANTCLINNSDTAQPFKTDLSSTVTNSSTSSWQNSVSLSFTEDITVTAGVPGDTVSEKSSMTIAESYGVGGQDTLATSISSSLGVTPTVQPNSALYAQLNATLTKLRVRVKYEATLSGCTAVNYNPKHKGHHFYCFDINSVLKAAGKKTKYETTQDIIVDSYANGDVILSKATIIENGNDCKKV